MSVAKTILKRLFRVYAHIYHQHFDPVIQLQEEAHLNTSFKHFIFFVQVSLIRDFPDSSIFCKEFGKFSNSQNLVKNPPVMLETWVRPVGWEDLLEKGKATHSSILAWRNP